MNLKTSLMLRIAMVAISCFVLVTAVTLWETQRQARAHGEEMADLVARQLNFQLLRINAGFDASKRFPDWGAIQDNSGGQCVRYYDDSGEMKRSTCVGSAPSLDKAPEWFAVVSRALISGDASAEREVSYKGKSYGIVVVTSEPEVVASRIWGQIRPLLILAGLTILSVCVFVYVAVERALAPTKEVIAGLDKLSVGEFSYRLPHFRLFELQRISEVSNQLAEKIETTLSERAELLGRLIHAQEEERRHLAGELHDEFGQNLTAIAALAASIETTAKEECPALGVEARSLSQISRNMMQSLRGTLLHLRPADLDKFGLVESLRQLIAVWSASSRHKTRFELHVPREIAPLADNAAIHVFRIAQEGLTNAAKHADAETVRLTVEPVSLAAQRNLQAAGLRLTIEDDGRGQRPNGKANGNGMGLLNMHERVGALGGSISFESNPGAGTTVRVVVPVDTGPEQHGEYSRD
jgi:signal transduction histidine kinase